MLFLLVMEGFFFFIVEKLSVPKSSSMFIVGPVVFQCVPFYYFVLEDAFFSLLQDMLPYCNKQVVRYIIVFLNKRMNQSMWWQFLGSRAIQVLYLLENFKRLYVTECASVKSFIQKKESKITELIKVRMLSGDTRIRHV